MAILYLSNGTSFSPLKIDLTNINAATFTPNEHNHNDLYNTKAEVDSKITTKINEIQIGGRNLLLNSKRYIKSSSYVFAYYPLAEPLKQGEIVTIQIKGKLNDSKTAFSTYNSGGVIHISSLSVTHSHYNEDTGIYTRTGTWFIGDASNTVLRIYHTPYSVTGVESEIEWIKLERGNKATDYSPAPEEVDAKIGALETSLDAKVANNDPRLYDYRNALDVYNWAKQDKKPTYNYSEIVGTPEIPAIPALMTYAEGNEGTSNNQRTINASILKSVILAHSPAGARPASNVSAWAKKASLQLSDMPAIPQLKITNLTDDLATKATIDYVDTKVASLVDSAPEALDTLQELAQALGDDPNFATTVSKRIGEKLKKVDFYDGLVMKKELLPSLDMGDIPALSASHITSGTFAVARIPSLAITKITNLESTLAGKANLASPTFTGNPTAPTQAAGNNTTRLATTAFVQREATNIVNAKMDNKSIKVLTQAQYNALGSSRDLLNTIYFIT